MAITSPASSAEEGQSPWKEVVILCEVEIPCGESIRIVITAGAHVNRK